MGVKTLFVDCYRREGRIGQYCRILERYSEVEVIRVNEIGKGCDSGFDAVVFSGSEWMLSEESPPDELIAFVRELRIPTLGICFGHQLLANCFGAEVKRGDRFIGYEEEIEMDGSWKLFEGLAPKAIMCESHWEYVIPESVRRIGWEIGAWSSSCQVEAIRHPYLPLYGVQFHPERSGGNGERLIRNFFCYIVRG